MAVSGLTTLSMAPMQLMKLRRTALSLTLASLVASCLAYSTGGCPNGDLLFSSVTSRSSIVSWSHINWPEGASNAPYILRYNTVFCGTQEESRQSISSNETSAIILYLHPHQAYNFTLEVRCSSESSAVCSFITASQSCTISSSMSTLEDVPEAAPPDITVDAEWTPNGTSVHVRWGSVDCRYRSGEITAYEIAYYAFDPSTGTYGKRESLTTRGWQTSGTIDNLRPWKGNLLFVRARTAAGLGPTGGGVYLSPAIPPPKGCSRTRIYIDETKSNYQLPDAKDEEEVTLISCDEGVRLKAVCLWQFVGLSMDYHIVKNESLCQNKKEPDVNPALRTVNLTVVTEDTALGSLEIIFNFTAAVTIPTATDLAFIADTFDRISQSILNESVGISVVGATKLSSRFADVIDNIMDPSVSLPSNDGNVLQATRKLTSNMEAILQSLMIVLSDNSGENTNSSRSVGIDNENMAYRATLDSSISGAHICSGGLINLTADSGSVTPGDCSAVASIRIPNLNSTKAFVTYSSSLLFDGATKGAASARTRVLGSVLGSRAAVQLDFVELQFNVSHVTDDRQNLACAFWNYTIGNWSFNGCDSFVNGNIVECTCNHLTHFAVLLDWRTKNIPPPPEALTIITRIGLSVSSLGLGMVIVSFLLFRSLRKTSSQRVLFCLSLTLLCLNLCFLVGFGLTEDRNVCIAMAALTHYFLLSSFMWMLVEGILQYLRLVKVLNAYVPNFIWKATVPSWGLPAAVVAALAAADSQHYVSTSAAEALEQCWVSNEVLIYAVVMPLGALVLVNATIFTLIVCSLRRGSDVKLRSNKSERELAILHVKASVSILFLLGISWVFGMLVFEEDYKATLAFQYLFCILNSLQGLMIFVFHNIREPFVRKQWQRLCCPSSYSRRDSTAMTSSSLLQSRRATRASVVSQN